MKNKRGFAIALVLIAVVLTLSLTACNGWLANSSDTSRFFLDIKEVEDARTASIVANNTIASCVRVITEYKNANSVVSTSASSGFIITEDGYVLTNRHCVVKYSTTGSDTPMFSSDKPMSANYSVVFADNKEYSASLVAFSSSADLAVLKINTLNLPLVSDGIKFQALVFETQEDLYYGQRVYTIGNPENIGLILTELTIASPAIRLGKNDEFDSVILDGNINHGNSGGPLFNAYSRISGIVYARIEGANKDTYGIGCAIATDTIIDFLDSIKTVKINYKTTPVTINSGNVA